MTQNAELANEFLISINELAAKCNSKLMSTSVCVCVCLCVCMWVGWHGCVCACVHIS